jgi:hypothetical protein
MNSRLKMSSIAFLLLAIVVSGGGCATAPDFRIERWRQPEGKGIDILVKGDDVRVVGLNDWNDARHELWKGTIPPEVRADIERTLDRLDARKLQDEYWTGTDGYQLRFVLPDGDGGHREVLIANTLVPGLVELTEHVDRVLPERFQLNYRNNVSAILEGQQPPALFR